MHAMQYEVTLPADYDMGVIRRRVADKGPLLDAFDGLGLKAYLIRERGTAGSPVNEYSPFYLWTSAGGMNRFLWGGGGFRGIVDDFGRPAVRHWVGAGFQPGPALAEAPRAATRWVEPIPLGVDPATAVAPALAELARYASVPGLHSAALAVDPLGWELVLFALWQRAGPDGVGQRYEVLHLSTPRLDEIGVGRHW